MVRRTVDKGGGGQWEALVVVRTLDRGDCGGGNSRVDFQSLRW